MLLTLTGIGIGIGIGIGVGSSTSVKRSLSVGSAFVMRSLDCLA